jgi:hypothetical protein
MIMLHQCRFARTRRERLKEPAHHRTTTPAPIAPMITTKPLISPGLPEYILSPPATTFVEDPIATIESRMTKIDRAHLDCVAVRIGAMLIIGMALCTQGFWVLRRREESD